MFGSNKDPNAISPSTTSAINNRNGSPIILKNVVMFFIPLFLVTLQTMSNTEGIAQHDCHSFAGLFFNLIEVTLDVSLIPVVNHFPDTVNASQVHRFPRTKRAISQRSQVIKKPTK